MGVFSSKAIGLDIQDRDIEIVLLKKNAGKMKIVSFGRVELAEGVLERGVVKDEVALLEALKEVASRAKPKKIELKNVVIGLPGAIVYTHIIQIPWVKKRQRDSHIKKEIASIMPIPMESLLYSYSILQEHKTLGIRVLVGAMEKHVFEAWNRVLTKARIPIVAFDSEAVALVNGIFSVMPKEPACIVDIGAYTSNIYIVDQNGFAFSHTSQVAGNYFTAKAAMATRVKKADVEKKKKTKGIVKKDRVSVALQKQVDELIVDIKKTLAYYESQYDSVVGTIIIAGHSSRMSGLAPYIEKKLEKTTSIASSPYMEKQTPLLFIEAIGLACRALKTSLFESRFQFDIPKIIVSKKEGKKENKNEKLEVISESIDEESVDVGKDEITRLDDLKEKDLEVTVSQRKTINIKEESSWGKIGLLVTVLIVGGLLLLAAFWYRDYYRQRVSVVHTQLLPTIVKKEFSGLLPIHTRLDTDTVPYSVPGRLVVDDTQTSVSDSKLLVEDQIFAGEVVYKNPIQVETTSSTQRFTWLVYESDPDLLLEKVFIYLKEQPPEKLLYTFSTVEYGEVFKKNNEFFIPMTVVLQVVDGG
ncbi:pilus assembly protein PilM [Patescibacteria group bacterium]|nr:pilus assembly protein PilM [Patescibacteria group bacterium]MBU1721172.1 pilus assembly protein PilM [Patescibacteria group bacterium]MBU1900898.1 pilus assembly protein PilM [Patescibacteria group bacterium]